MLSIKASQYTLLKASIDGSTAAWLKVSWVLVASGGILVSVQSSVSSGVFKNVPLITSERQHDHTTTESVRRTASSSFCHQHQ